MSRQTTPHDHCLLCGREYSTATMIRAETIRSALVDVITRRHPDRWTGHGWICRPCLNAERTAYIMDELERERGELSTVEQDVSRRAGEHLTVASHLDEEFRKNLTVGQRLADRVASVGGSWPFVVGFGLVLAAWIVVNTVVLRRAAFDPYPYILLNLLLSCLAAVQAPIIMMSQNRQAARDRLEADLDYRVNLKAEIEVATLHEKVDHLLRVQWERMVEIQQTQLDLLNEIAAGRTHTPPVPRSET